jgi:hypothetical protein
MAGDPQEVGSHIAPVTVARSEAQAEDGICTMFTHEGPRWVLPYKDITWCVHTGPVPLSYKVVSRTELAQGSHGPLWTHHGITHRGRDNEELLGDVMTCFTPA